MEYGKWCDRVTPEYDVTIPFTRMLAGPMDFTPGAFNNAARGQFKAKGVAPMSQGTRCHQLAMYVVYESPLVMVSDYPEAYKNQPAFEFIEKVPTVWDDTKVLSGEPAKFIAMARRNGNKWYVGAMTNWDSRDLEIPLSFLGDGEYEAQIFADGADADKVGTSVAISKKGVKAGDKLRLHLAPGGGAAVILSPARDTGTNLVARGKIITWGIASQAGWHVPHGTDICCAKQWPESDRVDPCAGKKTLEGRFP